MSSWAQDMYDGGYTSQLGGLMDGGGSRSRRSINSSTEETKPNKEPEWFATAKEAHDYAKKNVGTIITRSSDGNGYVIKKKFSNN